MVDCTILGAADEAAIFGTRGMYYNDGTNADFIPYNSFPSRTFNFVLDHKDQVSLGEGQILDIAGSKASVDDVLGMLEILKQAAAAKQRRLRSRDGLPG